MLINQFRAATDNFKAFEILSVRYAVPFDDLSSLLQTIRLVWGKLR